jgi:hypothetical protein
LLTLLSPVVSLVAMAQTPAGSHALGAGSLLCSSWSDARQNGKALEHGAWVLGFLSGFGSAWIGRPETVDPLNGMTAGGVFVWIDGYCEAQPSDLIAKAALAFVRAHPN